MTAQPNSEGASRIVTEIGSALVFANTQAGRGKTHGLIPLLEREFRKNCISAEIRTPSNSNDMESQVKDSIQRGARLLFAVGGDGTLQALVNAAFGHDVVLGVIPAGGGNDFARALGLPRQPLAALNIAITGKPRLVDLVAVRTSDGRQRLYLGGGGVGLDADTARLTGSRYKNWPGRSRYLAAAIRAYATHKPRRIRVTFESSSGTATWQKSVLACVLNTPTFGAGIRLAPNAHIDDGLLDLVFLEELGLARLLRVLPQLALHGRLQIPQLRTVQFRKLHLETETQTYFHGDGELLGLTPVEIEVAPGAARFLAPKPADS